MFCVGPGTSLSKPPAVHCTSPTFSDWLMLSVAMSGKNIYELLFAHRGESLTFILDCALSEEAPYFLWTKCADLTFD